jgi:hypothetical protein
MFSSVGNMLEGGIPSVSNVFPTLENIMFLENFLICQKPIKYIMY